jgi:hypothetical protein
VSPNETALSIKTELAFAVTLVHLNAAPLSTHAPGVPSVRWFAAIMLRCFRDGEAGTAKQVDQSGTRITATMFIVNVE